jgi:hypothetical protein
MDRNSENYPVKLGNLIPLFSPGSDVEVVSCFPHFCFHYHKRKWWVTGRKVFCEGVENLSENQENHRKLLCSASVFRFTV